MVDEDAYRNAYAESAGPRCPFTPVLLGHRAGCVRASRFLLAEREGIACNDPASVAGCTALYEALRRCAGFSVAAPDPDTVLPHGAVLRIQGGGLCGVQRILDGDDAPARVADIDALRVRVEAQGGATSLPTPGLVREIGAYRIRGGG